MEKRLAKIATELNVGFQHLVEFLVAKKHLDSANPTTKITPELEQVLLKQFQKDAAEKQQAQKLDIGSVSRQLEERERVEKERERAHHLAPKAETPKDAAKDEAKHPAVETAKHTSSSESDKGTKEAAKTVTPQPEAVQGVPKRDTPAVETPKAPPATEQPVAPKAEKPAAIVALKVESETAAPKPPKTEARSEQHPASEATPVVEKAAEKPTDKVEAAAKLTETPKTAEHTPREQREDKKEERKDATKDTHRPAKGQDGIQPAKKTNKPAPATDEKAAIAKPNDTKPTVEAPKLVVVPEPVVVDNRPKGGGLNVLGTVDLDALKRNEDDEEKRRKEARKQLQRDEQKRKDKERKDKERTDREAREKAERERLSKFVGGGKKPQGNPQNGNNNAPQRDGMKPTAEVVPPPPPEKVIPPPPEVVTSADSAKKHSLQGLRVLGKIDLTPEQPKGGSNDSDGGNRGKRKRKKVATGEKTGVDLTRIETGLQNNQGSGTGNRGGNNGAGGAGGNNNNRTGSNTGNANRTGTGNNNTGTGNRTGGGGGAGGGGNNNRPNTGQGGNANRTGGTGNRPAGQGGYNTTNRTGNAPGLKPKPNEVQEISKKDVEDKIRATMDKLRGTGKTKRSKIKREERKDRRDRISEAENAEQDNILHVAEFTTVSELASLMDVLPNEVILACMNLGYMVTINQRLEADVIDIVAEEFGFKVEFSTAEDQTDTDDDDIDDDPALLLERGAIVTVMGHVDHGKTSLLDYLHKQNVAAGEAGGITQHLGAYEIFVDTDFGRKKVTFIDTPGHEAFTAMRARGAKVTDIAIIVIAADDAVMPTTREAISHAQAAGVRMVFAINKIDKDGSNPERIREQLSQMNILVEQWGGTFQCQEISAKKGTGIAELLEKVVFESEEMQLKANPNRDAVGTVLEATLDKGRGYVTTLLVQSGTLRKGDTILVGRYTGRARAMFDEHGKEIKEAGPSTPVLMLGLNGAPQAGDRFKVMRDEGEARRIAGERDQIARNQQVRATKRLSLEEIGRRLALGNFRELKLILKADYDGSVEALSSSLMRLSTDEVQVSIVHRAVGAITESDVLLASASDAIIIGFQVRPSPSARLRAEQEGVQIKHYSIIYEVIEEIKAAMEGLLAPTHEEKIVATVEVRQTYEVNRVGTVIGAYMQDGKMTRNTKIRVIRDGIVVFPVKENQTGEVGSLRRFKDDVREVTRGLEFGMTIKDFNDIQIGDTIEGYDIVEIKRKL